MLAWIAAAAFGGAWTKDVGELYAKVGADLYRPVRFVQPGEARESSGTYLGQRYGLYAEAGVLPGWRGQLAVSAPLVVGTIRTEHVDAQGAIPLRATTVRAGDLDVAAQVAIHPSLPLAAAVEAKIPLYGNGSVGADYPTFSRLFPKPGDGQVNVTGWLYGGLSSEDLGFAELGVGYRHRTEWFVGWETPISLVDGVVLRAKAGRAIGRVLPIVGVESVVNVAKDAFTRESLTVYGTALVTIAEGVAVEPRVSGELWSRNASQGVGAGLGVSVRR